MHCEGALEPHEPLTTHRRGEGRAPDTERGSWQRGLPPALRMAECRLASRGPGAQRGLGRDARNARRGADGTQRLSQDTAQKKQKCQVPETLLQEQNKKTKFRRPFSR